MAARSPADVDRLFGEYANAGDLDALVGLYEPTAVLAMVPGGPPLVGTAAIRDGLAGFLATKPRLEMNVVKVIRAGDDLAILYNDFRQTAPEPLAGKAIEVVRRQADGTWRFVIDDPFARG